MPNNTVNNVSTSTQNDIGNVSSGQSTVNNPIDSVKVPDKPWWKKISVWVSILSLMGTAWFFFDSYNKLQQHEKELCIYKCKIDILEMCNHHSPMNCDIGKHFHNAMKRCEQNLFCK